MKKTILTASLSLLLAACASSGGTTASADDASKAIAAAEAANKQAASVGYEWRDTGKMIKAAQEAVEAKEYDKAVSLAGKAERQGMNAVKQQAEQAKVTSNI